MCIRDSYDAMQSLEYEINTLFTSNGQTPFTSLGFGLGTNRFEREIQKAILNIRIKGLGSEPVSYTHLATSKQCFEQPATSFLVCSLLFIEYQNIKEGI